ncbi:MAG: Brp/Blh family beta-carotene 15,15'-dioxygenase [Bacteroidota bacterium]
MLQQKGLFFDKLKSIMVVISVFVLWLSSYSTATLEAVLSCIFILSFGVLHGSNDIQLLHRAYRSKQSQFSVYKAVMFYILVVIGILGLFAIWPQLALPLFLLISGFHFGEQHWSSNVKQTAVGSTLFFSFYGLFILFMLFYVQREQVVPVLTELSGVKIQSEWLGSMFLFSAIGLVSTAVFLLAKKLLTIRYVEELFILLLLFIIFNVTSLIWSFSIYFILWHSIPSLRDQLVFLYGHSSKKTFIRYLKTSLPYWLVSIAGLGILYFFLKDNIDQMLSILVYFLAAITFPHVLVISFWESRIKSSPES